MTRPRPKLPLPGDPIYRAILIVLVVNVVLGAGLALFGEQHFEDPAVKSVGVGLALISGALYYIFRFLGYREARRRAAGTEERAGEDGQDEDRR